ncbi:germination protein YpeB [Psychrobacillus psychrodurans]|uniref:PepSY1/2 domain-containing protein n=1 Tax=Psychrobacillus TaxID=1221880 RepID=UPI0008E6E647|nr:PepSY1/2 domain-containing protein [Psychrobacillus psychrodurans]MCK1998052.1 germination protein YpeB [Psychrobacillus psychrodurans]MCZ8540119.1 germination protein YpeB [Psychrobacillus psychrodurans]SFM49720.1 spore germination protein [Psychrobacillus psychrodurans]
MKKIIWVIVSSVAVVFLMYHFSVQSQNNRLENALAVQYSNQLTSASEKLTKLTESVDQTMLFTDKEALEQPLDDVWRISSDIRTSISSLPISSETSTVWMNYLNRLGNGAAQVKNGEVPIEEWQKNMVSTRENLQALSDQWAFTNKDGGNKDYIVTAFVQNKLDKNGEKNWKSLGNSVKAYTESDFPMTASETDQQKKKDLQHIKDSEITEDEAKEQFVKLFPEFKDAKIHITESSQDAPYPFYHIEFHEGIRIGYADLTKKGGHILSFLLERPFEKTTITVQQMKDKSAEYMKTLGFTDTELVEYRENSVAWHLSFARKDENNDALIYADGIQLKIAKDNGELLGLNAMEYIQKEKIGKQEIVPLDNVGLFSSNFYIEEERLAYVENKQLEQRLAYQVLAKNDSIGTYKIYIDTENHEILHADKLP